MKQLFAPLDALLNQYTMYRVVLYGLAFLACVAIGLAFFNRLPFSGGQLLLLLVLILNASYVSHQLAVRLFKAIANLESYLITALILFFIMAPMTSPQDVFVTIGVCFLATFSKYLLAVEKKHLFNPVAIALVISGLFGFGNAIWWVGSSVLLPFVIIVGLVVVRKIRRFYLLWPFMLTALTTIAVTNLLYGVAITTSLFQTFSSWPLVFFASIMLTEPLTAPGRQRLSILYSGLVGIFFGAQLHLGPVHTTPEFALVVGNLFAYLVSPKQNLMLKLLSKTKIGKDLYHFSFGPKGSFSFLAGQYLEWTVPAAGADSRGNRRFFTIASAPSEKTIAIGVKIGKEHSTFKEKLLKLPLGSSILANHLSGDFVLPTDQKQKLFFVAGGIGVTPFRSMIKYLIDTKQNRDIVLFYVASDPAEFVYQKIFEEAEHNGLKVIYVVTRPENLPANWQGECGYLTTEMIQRHLPDLKERLCYLSGPNTLVDSCNGLLNELKIADSQIMTDYFPGF